MICCVFWCNKQGIWNKASTAWLKCPERNTASYMTWLGSGSLCQGCWRCWRSAWVQKWTGKIQRTLEVTNHIRINNLYYFDGVNLRGWLAPVLSLQPWHLQSYVHCAFYSSTGHPCLAYHIQVKYFLFRKKITGVSTLFKRAQNSIKLYFT